jgi:flagellar basal body-associated protein FliL
MSNNPQTGFPPGQPAPGYPQGGYPQTPRSGCGGCLGKFLIFLGVVFVLLAVGCCGGGYYLYKTSFTQQPAEIEAIAGEIISIRVPAPLEPVAGGRIKIPFAGTPLGQGAIFSDKDHTSGLFLASFNGDFGPQVKDQLIQILQSSQDQKQNPNKNEENEELKDAKTTKLEPKIQGEKAGFNITEGIGVQSGKKKIRVNGAFKGKTGPAIFVLNAAADTLSFDKVKEMIDSMK